MVCSRRVAAFCTLFLFSACATDGPMFIPSEGDLGYGTSEIFRGTPETGFPEVMYLLNYNGGACTGTLIAPRVFLTAKHCVQNGQQAAAAPASALRVYAGNAPQFGQYTDEYAVAEVIPMPGRWDLGDASDVALVILTSDARQTPRAVGFEGVSLVGQRVTSIGYGRRENGASGTKYSKTGVATQRIESAFLFVEPSVCSGDSGGPLLAADGAVHGVASFIYNQNRQQPTCGDPGAYNLIRNWRSMIEDTIGSTACEPMPETCNDMDDDCDGEVDEDCLGFGQACTNNEECSGGLCGETENGRICTRSCDASRVDIGCPQGLFCQQTNGCNGICAPVVAERTLGESCSSSGECRSRLCAGAVCVAPCERGDGNCFAGEACQGIAEGACGYCVNEGSVGGPRANGENCGSNSDCESGLCFEEDGLSYCSESCESDRDCGDAFHCRSNMCIRGPRQRPGGPCIENGDCASGFCVTEGNTRYCSELCNAGACPDGFTCETVGEAQVCLPGSSLLGQPCTANNECISDLCVFNTDAGDVCGALCDENIACPVGFECTRVGDAAVCLDPNTAGDDSSGGCGCSTQGDGSSIPFGLLLLVATAMLIRRRNGAA